MTQQQANPTSSMFECLVHLYKQSQLLLMDADRLVGERGWEPMRTSGTAGLSNSLNSPEHWFARWATRFYMSATDGTEEASIDRILFVSTHVASDHDTEVDEPLVSAGRLIYGEPMNEKTAQTSFNYWMCKYWFYGKPHKTLQGWHGSGQSRFHENLKGSETFIVPLYDITSSEKLDELVIVPLLDFDE